MAKSLGWLLVLWLVLTGALPAQQLVGEAPQTNPAPRHKSPSQRNQLRAMQVYAAGMLHQRNDRLFEALKCFEEARRLDPKSAAVCRALIPIFFALGRDHDALAACRETLELDADDPDTAQLYARQLRELGQTKEAIAVLAKATAAPSSKDHLELLVQMHHDLGLLCEEAGLFGQAANAFERVAREVAAHRQALVEAGILETKQVPAEIAHALERVGQACIKAKEFDRAVKAFTEAQRTYPENAARLDHHLAQVYLAQDKPDRALPHLQRYLQTQPPGADAYETMVAVLKKLKRNQEILATLQDYAGRDRFNIALQLLVARQLGQEKRFADAERSYLKLAEENPAIEPYQGLFQLFQEQKRGDRIVDLLDQTLKAALGDEGSDSDRHAAVRARVMLNVLKEDLELAETLLPALAQDLASNRERHPETWRLMAVLMVRTHHLELAEKLYRACLPHVKPENETEVYAGLLDTLSDRGSHAEVVQLAREGLAKAQATNAVLFRTKLSAALVQLGKYDEAIQEADEAVKLANDTNRLRLRVYRVEMLRRCDRFDQAIHDCEEMLKEYFVPGDVRNIRHVLSGVYLSAHQPEKAQEQLRLILELDPADAGANNDLGYTLADHNKNLDEAEKLIRKAIELDREEKKRAGIKNVEKDGDNAAYLDSLGWVLFRQGKLEDARTWLEKATALADGQDPVLYDHLGDVYLRLQLHDKARAAWKKALELYETSAHRKKDDRFQEIQNKLQLLAGK